MSSSEDSEIIQRSRHHKRARRVVEETSFDSEEQSSGEGMRLGDCDPLFREIFGTGYEYDYIYSEEPPSKAVESKAQLQDVDRDACGKFIRSHVTAGVVAHVEKGLVNNLLDGHCPEYLSFAMQYGEIRSIYYVQDLIEEYRKGALDLDPSGGAAGKGGAASFKGLLSVREYAENIKAMDRLYEPTEDLDGDAMDDTGKYQAVINQIAANPTFRKAVNNIYEQDRLSQAIKDTARLNKDVLFRLSTTSEYSSSNEMRMKIVEKACELVSINKREIDGRLFRCGLSGGVSENSRSFLNLFQSLPIFTNAMVSLKGPEGSYAGCYYDRGFVKIVLLDETGKAIARSTFNETDIPAIHSFIPPSFTVCLSANTSAVRYFLQKLKMPFLYVPASLAYFNDLKDFSVPYGIAFAVQNPLVHFSRLVYSSGTTKAPPFCSKMVSRAVRLAAAILKPDWRATLKYKHNHTLLHTLGVRLSQSYFDYAGVPSFAALQSAMSLVDLDNLTTYFRLSDSTNPLDATYVHLKDYPVAQILCKSAYLVQRTSQDEAGAGVDLAATPAADAVVREILLSPRLLKDIVMPKEVEEYGYLKELLVMTPLQHFSGATDAQIFEDIVPSLAEQEKLDGTIVKVGTDFYIVECQAATAATSGCRTATVYVRKSAEYILNQTVEIVIARAQPHMLSYSGEIVNSPETVKPRFIQHRLFRNIDQISLQKLMGHDGQLILVRPSSQPNAYVVVCRLQTGIFYSIKIHASDSPGETALASNPCFSHDGKVYSSLDDFLDKYVKQFLRTVYMVSSYRHFFRSEADAMAYINSPGEYLKHAVILSRANPGCMEFLFKNKRVLVKLDCEKLIYRNNAFSDIDSFIRFAKVTFK